GDGLPVPLREQTGAHGVERDGLGADHGEHRALAEVGLHRGETEPAVAEHHRGHAVPARDAAPRIPTHLGVVVGVEIDGARGDDASAGVDHSFGGSLRTAAELRDPAILYPEVTLVAGNPSPVDDGAVLDVNVVALHFSKPPSNRVLTGSVTLPGPQRQLKRIDRGAAY